MVLFDSRWSRRAGMLAAALAVALPVLGSGTNVRAAAPSGAPAGLHLTRMGSTSLSGAGGGTLGHTATYTQMQYIASKSVDDGALHPNGHSKNLGLNTPAPQGRVVTSSNPGWSGMAGVNNVDQSYADNGQQYDLEPPDQGLCVGNGFVMEPVNTALSIYRSDTHQRVAGPIALNPFFKLGHEIDWSTFTFGPSLGDPRCLYDSATGHWYVTSYLMGTNPDGSSDGTSGVAIAVSQTSDPTGNWTSFRLDTTDNTGTAAHTGCPCFPDQPLLGADANGIYISTNEYSLNPFGAYFNGTQLYAISKAQLNAAASAGNTTLPGVVHFDNLYQAGEQVDSLQPAASPAGSFATANGGTEYFMRGLDFGGSLVNQIGVWALTNTQSLNSGTPSLHLVSTLLDSVVYGANGYNLYAKQQSGQRPLADWLHNTIHDRYPENLSLLNADDDRMQQVVYAGGTLYSGLNTVAASSSGTNHVAIAYFVVSPSSTATSVSASMVKQGYLNVSGEDSVMYPSIGVNAQGKGIMAFSLSGPSYFPTAAYTTFDAVNGPGTIHIAGPGAAPLDGFAGYSAFGGNGVDRFGDYSAAVADSDGSIWIASQNVSAQRDLYANWGTFISQVQP